MLIKKAVNKFLGKDGEKRLNCAQAIMDVFGDASIVEEFKSNGGGRSPNGYCGAYYAVKMILEDKSSDRLDDLDKRFFEYTGSLKCREIRRFKKVSCVDCVKLCAEILEEVRN